MGWMVSPLVGRHFIIGDVNPSRLLGGGMNTFCNCSSLPRLNVECCFLPAIDRQAWQRQQEDDCIQ
jgi:hypothetical protein